MLKLSTPGHPLVCKRAGSSSLSVDFGGTSSATQTAGSRSRRFLKMAEEPPTVAPFRCIPTSVIRSHALAALPSEYSIPIDRRFHARATVAYRRAPVTPEPPLRYARRRQAKVAQLAQAYKSCLERVVDINEEVEKAN